MTNRIITIKDMKFVPEELSINKNETVVWQNEDMEEPHTATSYTNVWDTGYIAEFATSNPIIFDFQGQFPYHCKFHPHMSGNVSVQ